MQLKIRCDRYKTIRAKRRVKSMEDVVKSLRKQNLKPSLDSHCLDQEPLDSHILAITKQISERYCKVRMYHEAKSRSSEIIGTKIRSKLSRTIIFKGQ